MAALEPRFLGLLQQARVPDDIITLLGAKGYDTAHIFGSVTKTDSDFFDFCKAVLNIDPAARADDWVKRSRLTMVWEGCKVRVDVEHKHIAERAVMQLPPQVAIGELEAAKRALEAFKGFEIAKHHCPSEPYFEKKIAHATSFFEAEPLSVVTSKAQEEAHAASPPHTFDSLTGTFKQVKKEFMVPLLETDSELRNRFEIMGNAFMMVKMKFGSNPRLASCALNTFTDYAQFLCGSDIWGFVTKDSNGTPTSSPHIGHVRGYDMGIREHAAKAMNNGKDFKSALEGAIADMNLRHIRFLGNVASR